MNNIDTYIGIFALVFGLLCLGAYGLLAMGREIGFIFHKLVPMRERFGKVPGTIIHFVAYVAVPIAVGVVLLTRQG